MGEVAIMKGWALPFFPMRPATGPRINKKVALEILEKQEDHRYLFQPKLNGDRAMLGISDRKVVIATRHYSWYQFQVQNARDFLKLGDGTLFDGEVWGSNFYPFECLALEGRSYKINTVEEREIMAMQMCRLVGVQWMYPKPTKKWLLNLSANLPKYEGVVRKRCDLPYMMLTNASASSSGWLKLKW